MSPGWLSTEVLYILLVLIFRFMFGLEFPGEEQHKCVFLVDAWKVLATKQFWKGICCHSSEGCILMVTACGKINDPKHTSNSTKKWMKDNGIDHWVTPLNHQLVIKLTSTIFCSYLIVVFYCMLDWINNAYYLPLTHWVAIHPDAPYFSILLCLTPDDFTRQWESTGA